MVINKINNKVFQPIVYKNSKEKSAESGGAEKQTLSEEEVKKIRLSVIKEINKKTEPLTAKKNFKKSISLKALKTPLPKIKAGCCDFFKEIKIKKDLIAAIKLIVILLLFLFIISTIGIYLAAWQGGAAKKIAGIIPYPAVYINGRVILVNDFFTDLAALENYLQRNKLVYTKESIRKKVMQNLIEREAIKQLAASYNITVSPQEIENELNQSLLRQTSQEQINQAIAELYHWNFSEYTDKVIMPLVLSKKTNAEYDTRSGNQSVKERMIDYQKQILAVPSDFEAVAATVNEDNTKIVAGDLGWLKLGEINPQLELALLNLDNNEVSDIVETAAGYYLIKLNEKIINEDKQPVFHASQIYLKKSSFSDYLNEQIKKATIVTLIKI